jgi:hypothetical protein
VKDLCEFYEQGYGQLKIFRSYLDVKQKVYEGITLKINDRNIIKVNVCSLFYNDILQYSLQELVAKTNFCIRLLKVSLTKMLP